MHVTNNFLTLTFSKMNLICITLSLYLIIWVNSNWELKPITNYQHTSYQGQGQALGDKLHPTDIYADKIDINRLTEIHYLAF